MKTSNILLLTALTIFLVSLGVYNMALRAEYLTGNYKSPFNNYNALALKDFDEVDINGSSHMNVRITKGDFKVWKHKHGSDHIKLSVEGKRLIVNVDFPNDYDRNEFSDIIIYCPVISVVKTQSYYTLAGKKMVDNATKPNQFNYHNISIENFAQDSLKLAEDNDSKIELYHNKIGYLNAVTGVTDNCTPSLKIDKSNTIQKADLQINQKAELSLSNIYIPQLKYHFSDSAKVSFSGAALKNLNKQ